MKNYWPNRRIIKLTTWSIKSRVWIKAKALWVNVCNVHLFSDAPSQGCHIVTLFIQEGAKIFLPPPWWTTQRCDTPDWEHPKISGHTFTQKAFAFIQILLLIIQVFNLVILRFGQQFFKCVPNFYYDKSAYHSKKSWRPLLYRTPSLLRTSQIKSYIRHVDT